MRLGNPAGAGIFCRTAAEQGHLDAIDLLPGPQRHPRIAGRQIDQGTGGGGIGRPRQAAEIHHHRGAGEQLRRTPKALPSLWINPAVSDLFAFRYEDFRLENYVADATIRAPIAV